MTSLPALPFIKMEGLGNDFIVFDLRHDAALRAALGPAAAAARALCDRHFGIGADGLLLIGPSAAADARMMVVNADGSEAEMCGNGLRCVAAYLAATPGRLAIETGAGVLRCEVGAGPEGPEVEISMGAATVQHAAASASALGRAFPLTALSMGNPHAVVFLDGDDPLRPLAERYGPVLERAPLFPARANIEFARLRPGGDIDLVVWERGAGLTLACGTGACATVAAAVLHGRRAAEQVVPVHLPGGTLQIRVREGLRDVLMRGPAREVFRGTVAPAALRRPPGPPAP